MALVRQSGQLEEFEEFLFDKDGNKICLTNKNFSAEFVGACCRYKRKGFVSAESIFTVDDAKRAGVWGKAVWNVYPKRMIQVRARSVALKDGFADILGGVSLGEYDHNTVIEKVVESEVVNGPTGAAKLAALAGIDSANEAISEVIGEVSKELKAEVLEEENIGEFASYTEAPIQASGGLARE